MQSLRSDIRDSEIVSVASEKLYENTLATSLTFFICMTVSVIAFFWAANNLPDDLNQHIFDLLNFSLLTVLFSLLIVAASFLLTRFINTQRWLTKLGYTLLGAVVAAILWAVMASQLLWPYLREIDLLYIPVIPIWTGAAIVAIAFILLISPRPGGTGLTTPMRPRVTCAQVAVLLFFQLPLTLALLLLVPFMLNWSLFAEPELYLIPAGYQGPVMIADGMANGQPAQYEGRARIYKVPTSGVLLTQFSQTRLVGHSNFYCTDDKGHRTRIPFAPTDSCDQAPSESEIIVCPFGLYTDSSFQGYIIGKISNMGSNRQAFEELFQVTFPANGP